MSISPIHCAHPMDARTKIREPVWVYGTPGYLFARYRCTACEIEWDDPTEKPPEPVKQWSQAEIPAGVPRCHFCQRTEGHVSWCPSSGVGST